MLDPGTESIITACASPAILTLVVGFLFKKHLEKIEEVAKTVAAIQVKSAVAESRNALVDKLGDDLHNLQNEHTKTRSSVEAVWRALDKERLS